MSIAALNRRIDALLEQVHQRLDTAKPSYGLVLYRPLDTVEQSGSRLGIEDYHNMIAEQQPEVASRLAEYKAAGIRVFVWLPEKDDDTEGNVA